MAVGWARPAMCRSAQFWAARAHRVCSIQRPPRGLCWTSDRNVIASRHAPCLVGGGAAGVLAMDQDVTGVVLPATIPCVVSCGSPALPADRGSGARVAPVR